MEIQIKMKSHSVDGGWAWMVLLASFLTHLIVFGFSWSTGVYTVIFLEAFGKSKSVTAWVGILPSAVVFAIGPLSGVLSNKFGFRKVIIVGGAMASLGLGLSYFATSLYYLFFTFLLTGVGFGLTIIPVVAALPCYFDKKISIAAGIASSGVGIGNFLYPALIRWLINLYNWRQSLLILSAVSFNLCVLGALTRPVYTQTNRKGENSVLDLSSFRKKSYLMLCLNCFLFSNGIAALYVHLAAYGEYNGFNADKSAMLISGLGIGNVGGRIGYGIISHHCNISVFLLYGVSIFVSGLCICIVPLVKSYSIIMAFSAMFGLLSGCFGTLMVNMVMELVGLSRFANGFSFVLLFIGAGQMLGASAAGALVDVTESYTMAFMLGGGLCILSSLVMIHPYCYIRNHSRPDIVDIPVETIDLNDTGFTKCSS